MSTYVTSGLVLKVSPWRETDRLYSLLTSNRGRVEVIAAGARKLVSKLSPHLLPFAEIDLMIAHGKQLDRLASAKVGHIYLKPPYELPNSVLASCFLEIARILTEAEQPEPKLYKLVKKYLSAISELPISPVLWRDQARVLLACYLVESLKEAGLAISLVNCEVCKKELAEPAIYSWRRHDFLHQACLSSKEESVPLVTGTLVWLQQAMFGNINLLDKKFLPTTLTFLTDYFSGHVGRSLYTLRVLRSIL